MPLTLLRSLNALAAALCLAACSRALVASSDDGAVPWPLRPEGWRTDVAWYDGKAEKCVYEATRTIYGRERRYLATAYTNKQLMDPETTTKSPDERGVEVFKHHWSECIPTERYDYDFSTATFTRSADLAPFKLTAATQEDCGASFKQVWREGDELVWFESVYFPGGRPHQGRLPEGPLHFADELPLLLRDFPFARGEERQLLLLASQKDTHQVSFAPERFTVRCTGREALELPYGALDAWRVELVDRRGSRVASLWFAVEERAPLLRVLLRYEGPGGCTYQLKSLERTAYWERS